MNYILFDDSSRANLLPLTFTRPMVDLRIGILTIREKWEKVLGVKTVTHTETYLSKKYPLSFLTSSDNIWINGSVCPNKILHKEVKSLQPNQALFSNNILLALNSGTDKNFSLTVSESIEKIESRTAAIKLHNVWDIFSLNGQAIQEDFELITKGRTSAVLSTTNQVISPEHIFVEQGAKVECAILNASTGPIYIGKDAEIMEGSIVRGPFALCEHSILKMGAKIYGSTTIGPHSKVGGEVNNSVIFGYSNKAHDGFLGNAVVGEWCNIGADSNNSNLKNTYAEVELWNYASEQTATTGLIFCGLIMGDHAKCGINTMFNTGTVVGVNTNIFGAGFPPKFIPDFSWGGASSFTTYKLPAAILVAKAVMSRRSLELSELDKEILKHVFEITAKYRE